VLLSQGGPPPEAVLRIDAPWFRQSLHDDLSKILAAAPTASGAFHSRFGRRWQPEPGEVTNATAQGRVLYVLAAGYDLTGDARYRAELRRGADFLLRSFIDRENGGVYQAVGFDGAALDARKLLYSQAFALFGLAHAYRVTRDGRYLRAAAEIWERVRSRMRDAEGGFVAKTDREFADASPTRDQNPIMHLFEALLAMYDATADPQWLRDAGAVGEFVLTRLVRETPEGKCIAELYDTRWLALPAADGGYVDLGHQAEWAWLLSAGAERGLPARYVDIGGDLLGFAVANGYDRAHGGLFWRIDATGGAVSREKLWWVQSEFLRATLRYAMRHGRTDLREPFEATFAFVRAELVDRENGGWYESPRSECARTTCADEQPDVGYHVVALYTEALALSGTATTRPLGDGSHGRPGRPSGTSSPPASTGGRRSGRRRASTQPERSEPCKENDQEGEREGPERGRR
jgi:mannose-6-phosphate isomerase